MLTQLITFAKMVTRLGFADEGDVDLSKLGMGEASPYLIERNGLWILLPLLTLAFVFLHLIKKKKRRP